MRNDQEYVDGQFVDRHIGDYVHSRSRASSRQQLARANGSGDFTPSYR